MQRITLQFATCTIWQHHIHTDMGLDWQMDGDTHYPSLNVIVGIFTMS